MVDKTGLLHFLNKRAEMWWNGRQLLDPANGLQVALPPDKRLKSELTACAYQPTPHGIKVESKDEVKKRLRRSTDVADAVLMSLMTMGVAQDIVTVPFNW